MNSKKDLSNIFRMNKLDVPSWASSQHQIMSSKGYIHLESRCKIGRIGFTPRNLATIQMRWGPCEIAKVGCNVLLLTSMKVHNLVCCQMD